MRSTPAPGYARRPLLWKTCLKKADDCGNNSLEAVSIQGAQFCHYQGAVCGEQFAWAGITGSLKRAGKEIGFLNSYRKRISVGIACDLAQNPVVVACQG